MQPHTPKPFHPSRRLLRVNLVVALLLVAQLLLSVTPAMAQDAPPAGSTGTVDVSGSRLNVRGGPGSEFPIVGKLAAGATVTVLERSADGAWLKVAAAGLSGEGWVAAAFIAAAAPGPVGATAPANGLLGAALGGAAARVSPTPAATAAALLPTPTPRATAAAAATPAPTAAATLAATVAPTADSTAEPTADSTAEPTAAPTEVPAEATEPTAVTQPASMNVRGGPGTAFARVGSAAAGTRLKITGVTPAGDWFRVELADGGEGWVSAALVRTVGPVESIAKLAEADLPKAPVQTVAVTVAGPVVGAGYGGGFGFGVTASMWQGDKAGVANAVADLGFTWVKQQVRWEFVEPAPGAVDWKEMDDIVNTMNGYGINVAFSVVTAPAWTRPTLGGTNGPPEDFGLFANFLGAVAGRYCGQSLKAIEVWNEQNLRREWEGFPLEPAKYMDLLRPAYNAIKGACPSMLVISGATTPAGYSDVAFDDIDYLRGMYQNGLAAYSDGVGIHPSGFGNPPTVRFADWQSGAYTAESHVNHRSFYFLSTLEESRAVMQQFGDTNALLWPTEFGWGSAAQPYPGYEYQARISEQTQANWIVESFRLMANTGYVGPAFLWNLNYNYGEMQNFAIQGRAAYAALKALTGR